MYGSYISWIRPNLPLPRLIDPRAAFERMFGARDKDGRPLPKRSQMDEQSMLDAALGDARDWSASWPAQAGRVWIRPQR